MMSVNLIISYLRRDYEIKGGGWSKVTAENMLSVLSRYENELKELGYDSYDDRKALAKILADRAIGLYREIKSQAMVDGSELLSLGIALSVARK